MRSKKIRKDECKVDGSGNLYTFDSEGKIANDIPAHTLQGKETTEFELALRRSQKTLLDEERKPLPTGEKYHKLIEKHGQLRLLG